eukprot:TRINITY_DN32364_c0_g1_i1.p1 TRINITY_DN32364_c0_g1~~TRINITY_DN32364_c0_g1_i1.p1  ORF type:complete len:176 (-),score=35.28 TRINITY_DN32364_c0_g1_i1:44-571(-)
MCIRDSCEALRDMLADLSGSRTVPRVFARGVFIGGCDDLQELECAGKLREIVGHMNAAGVSAALAEARPERSTWPETAEVTIEFQDLRRQLVVECDTGVSMLKRRCLEALEGEETPGAVDVLMLCQGLPFPLTRSAGSHASLVDGLSLIHISEPTRLLSISYAVFCLKKKTQMIV